MKARAAVLEAFHQPLALREFEVQPLARGEVLVKIAAAGVCGSDVHMWHGQDPRTPLPLILGHEGVGEIADTGGERRDLFGRAVRPGDRVMWERARMCGHCYFCVVRKEPSLCPNRRTYGIAFSCAEPPHLRGCYAEYLHLDATGSHLIRIEDGLDPAALVAACCSGATAANAIERAAIRPGDVVLVIGPGPLGLFCAAMAARAGAAQVCVVGTARSKPRLELAPAFGATATLCLGDTTEADRRAFLLDRTHGVGPNVVLDCSGAVSAVAEFLPLTAPGGVYSLPGIAEPREPLPVRLFEWLARKSVSLQGVWVSDTRHLYAAIQLVLSGEFPFGKLVTHRFPLDQATAALEAADSRQAIKAVLEP